MHDETIARFLRQQRRETGPRETTRQCPVEFAGYRCEKPADRVSGFYETPGENGVVRRIRVWACADHAGDNPLRRLPVPETVTMLVEIRAGRADRTDKRGRVNQDPERGMSVKHLAPTGSGKALKPPSRALGFRWEKARYRYELETGPDGAQRVHDRTTGDKSTPESLMPATRQTVLLLNTQPRHRDLWFEWKGA